MAYHKKYEKDYGSSRESSFDIDDFFNAALKRSDREMGSTDNVGKNNSNTYGKSDGKDYSTYDYAGERLAREEARKNYISQARNERYKPPETFDNSGSYNANSDNKERYKKRNGRRRSRGGKISIGSSSTSFIPEDGQELYRFGIVHEKLSTNEIKLQREKNIPAIESAYASEHRATMGFASNFFSSAFSAIANVFSSLFQAISQGVTAFFGLKSEKEKANSKRKQAFISSVTNEKNGYYNSVVALESQKYKYKDAKANRRHQRKLAKQYYKHNKFKNKRK